MGNKQDFLIHNGLEGRRIYTVISLENENSIKKQYRFYRSSGNNSSYEETWFPMFEKEAFQIIKPFQAPGYDRYNSYPHNFRMLVSELYEEELLKLSFKNGIDELFDRFGNIECLFISYLLNTGFWLHDDSKILKEFLEMYYSNQLNLLKKEIRHFNSFENPEGEEISGPDLFRHYKEKCPIDEEVDYSISPFEYKHDGTLDGYFCLGTFNAARLKKEEDNKASKVDTKVKNIPKNSNPHQQTSYTVEAKETRNLGSKDTILLRLDQYINPRVNADYDYSPGFFTHHFIFKSQKKTQKANVDLAIALRNKMAEGNLTKGDLSKKGLKNLRGDEILACRARGRTSLNKIIRDLKNEISEQKESCCFG